MSVEVAHPTAEASPLGGMRHLPDGRQRSYSVQLATPAGPISPAGGAPVERDDDSSRRPHSSHCGHLPAVRAIPGTLAFHFGKADHW